MSNVRTWGICHELHAMCANCNAPCPSRLLCLWKCPRKNRNRQNTRSRGQKTRWSDLTSLLLTEPTPPHHINPVSTVTCRIASTYIQFCTTHDVPALTRNMPCGPIVNSGSSPVLTLTLPVATEQRRLLFASGSSVNVPPEWIVSTRNDTSSQMGTTWLVERKALEKAMSALC